MNALISRESGLYTLINVTDVGPARQSELVALYSRITADVMSRADGFVSASLHRSLDGGRVVNYVQWRREDDFARARQNPEFLSLVRAVSTYATSDPRPYEVVSVAVGSSSTTSSRPSS
jgi:quinol monooxygenase YgiN